VVLCEAIGFLPPPGCLDWGGVCCGGFLSGGGGGAARRSAGVVSLFVFGPCRGARPRGDCGNIMGLCFCVFVRVGFVYFCPRKVAGGCWMWVFPSPFLSAPPSAVRPIT